jgi:hypothetical protein
MRKKISALIIFFMLFNSLGSLGAVEPDACEAIGCTLSRQPVISCFFLLSSVPLEIVARLVSENGLLDPASPRPASKKKEKPQKNSSALFSLCDSGLKSHVKNLTAPENGGCPVLVRTGQCPEDRQRGMSSPPGAAVIIPLLLLILLVMLPRSGIRGSSVCRGVRIFLPNLTCSSWVFYFP